ncbi:MAG: phosphoadenosine phosphosulfate reductase family protein [Alistipes sp.]|nr:phosphoadenosine phosphosulfate reductase family protein [Alistipes sp.]
MRKALEVIGSIATRASEVVLFHSASGKDSIAMLDLLYPHFDRILCVFMYTVPNLRHINRYINYARTKYPKAEFIQVPHYALFSYYQSGYMGCAKRNIRKYNLSQLTDIIRTKYSIEWACYGFKQSDGMNRRLMLRGYEQNAICEATHKFFPLSEYKNSDVLAYIEEHNLIKPEKYGNTQSAGTNISDLNYLNFLRTNYPDDLRKVIAEFPMVERLLFEQDYEATKNERDEDN